MPVLDADNRAVEFIRQSGGELYIWTDDAGLVQTAVVPPQRDQTIWERINGDNITVLVDSAIEPPGKWTLTYKRFPRRHVAAVYNGGQGGLGALRVPMTPGQS